MLQVLQYLVGTSIAAVDDSADLIRVQSVVGGPRRRGSSFSSWCGNWWTFRGNILEAISKCTEGAPVFEATYSGIRA